MCQTEARAEMTSPAVIVKIILIRSCIRTYVRYTYPMEPPFAADIAVMNHSDIDDALRATELQLRALNARRARILSAAAALGSHQVSGHRTIPAYIRATNNSGTATAKRDHTLAKLVGAHPEVADALEAGHISTDHAHEIARIHTNPRINEILDAILDSLLSMAEHLSLGEFRIQVGTIIGLADQDGAFDEQQRNTENRRAWADDMDGSLHLTASGGDPLQAAQLVAIFESFAEAEFQADLEARRAEFGDHADAHPLPRTQSQRNFDALVHIFAAAAGSPDASKLPEPTVNVIIDEATLHDTLTHGGLTLPSGNQIAIDEDGNIIDSNAVDSGVTDAKAMLADLTATLVDNPGALATRMCNLSTGAAIHPSVVLQALLNGHIRRVVVDSRNVVTELGTRSRVFTGAAREAALLLSNFCTHPGCTVRARHSQVDHMMEWADGGETSQHNAQARCGSHNRFKHREHMRSKRDERGRTYDIRPDGTIVLPVGERPPDLTHDDFEKRTRQRLQTLIAARPIPA